MKITFACIVFNGDFVLRQLIESIYPFAQRIIFVDGVVKYWGDKGYTKSTDDTLKIIESYPDPEGKIFWVTGVVAEEKTALCREFMELVPDDCDYLWCIDSDEIFKPEDIEKVVKVLEDRKPGSIGFKSKTFFGGFDHVLTGFEAEHDFKRILKFEKGCEYVTHRPPTLSSEKGGHISGKEMSNYGVEMYHYSYVSPKQVFEKIQYYKESLSKDNCIDNYFNRIWLTWVLCPELRNEIEDKFNGVHEFLPSYRGECRTAKFEGEHPEVIKRDLIALKDKFNEQFNEQLINYYIENMAL